MVEVIAKWLHEHEDEHAVGYSELDENQKNWYRMFAKELVELMRWEISDTREKMSALLRCLPAGTRDNFGVREVMIREDDWRALLVLIAEVLQEPEGS